MELVARPEERLDRLRGQVAMARAYIHHERIGRERLAWWPPPQPLVKSAAHQVLDLGAVG